MNGTLSFLGTHNQFDAIELEKRKNTHLLRFQIVTDGDLDGTTIATLAIDNKTACDLILALLDKAAQ